MAGVYVIDDDGKSKAMESVICTSEDKELQTILKNNFDLLPGDQIDPDAPCRWMLVKREMPVPDPSTGTDRWNVDFFFVDQNAKPTFVECKRYLDTRSRREVVGQVLEYAANGQHSWSCADFQMHADATAKEDGTTIGECFAKLQTEIADSPDAFFKEVERRLKAGEVRVVFFLEQAPTELKRLVEFLNNQMTMEVLLVEARQYSGNGIKIVVPTLFGFTEQIRETKRAFATEQNKKPVAIDWDSFRTNAVQKGLDEQGLGAIRKLYDKCKSLQADIVWGRGTVVGSFSPRFVTLNSRVAPFSVFGSGNLDLHLTAFQASDAAKSFATSFATKLLDGGVSLPSNYMQAWVTLHPENWLSKVDVIITALQDALASVSAKSATA